MLLSKRVRPIAVASRSGSKAREFAAMFSCDAVTGYENLLRRDDIDAVYLPLPTGLHEEWVTRSLEAGKHVLVEKSFAANHDSALRMIDLARRSKLLVMENFMFLYHSQTAFVRDLIGRGEIGELRGFRSSFGFPPLDEDNFRYKKALGGGALLDAAAYTVRASQLFLGDEPEVKAARLITPENAGVDIYGGAFMTAANGLVAQLAWGFDNFYQCRYELWGSQGRLVAHRAFTAGPGYKPTISLEKPGEKFNYLLDADNHFANLLEQFANCVRSDDKEEKYREIENQSKLLDQVRRCAIA